MQRADQHTQQQIADLVNACAGYWELRGIERARNNEMQLELEQHLQQAVHDGKSLEAVLGPNPLGFAEAWAREMHPRFWRGGARCLSGLVYVLSIVSTTALISQLLSRASVYALHFRGVSAHRQWFACSTAPVGWLPRSTRQNPGWARGAHARRCRAGCADPAPGRDKGELEHGTPLLELADDRLVAHSGRFPVFPR